MKDAKGFLINPWTKTITEAVVNGDHTELYKLLSPKPGDVPSDGEVATDAPSIAAARAYAVGTFTVVTLNDAEDTLYLDDDGHLKEGNRVWRWSGYPSALAGIGLILGTDDEGDTVSVKEITLDGVRAAVTFGDEETTATFAGAGDLVDPRTGNVYGYTSGQPVLRPVICGTEGGIAGYADLLAKPEDR